MENKPTTHAVSFYYSDRTPQHEVYYDFNVAVARYDELFKNSYGLQQLILRQRGLVVSEYKDRFCNYLPLWTSTGTGNKACPTILTTMTDKQIEHMKELEKLVDTQSATLKQLEEYGRLRRKSIKHTHSLC